MMRKIKMDLGWHNHDEQEREWTSTRSEIAGNTMQSVEINEGLTF
jgi:hypothetical protein